MEKEIKAKWIEALRSGKYKQAKGQLLNPKTGGMCCLGVLCSISGISNDVMLRHKTSIEDTEFGHAMASISRDQKYILAAKNDSGLSFNIIAKWIENNL